MRIPFTQSSLIGVLATLAVEVTYSTGTEVSSEAKIDSYHGLCLDLFAEVHVGGRGIARFPLRASYREF